MDLNNKYIKIKDKNHFNEVVKFLEKNGYRGDGLNYEQALYYITNNNNLPHYILTFKNKDYGNHNHTGSFDTIEFILPKESLKDKLIELFNNYNTIIKVNSKEEFIKYTKLLDILGFIWGNGVKYSNTSLAQTSPMFSKIKNNGYYLHRPTNGTGVSLMKDTDKLIEFKELLNYVNYE